MKPIFFVLIGALLPVSCNLASPEIEMQTIAKEAYIYAYPMVQQYATMYAHAIDCQSESYKAPLNHLSFESVTPCIALGEAWIDFRTNSYVLHIPKQNDYCQLSVQITDLYSNTYFHIDREEGAAGGDFLLQGRARDTFIPEGVKKVIVSETDFACVLIKICTKNRDSVVKWNELTEQIAIEPVHIKSNKTAAADFPPYMQDTGNIRFYGYLSFLLQFCNVNPSDKRLIKRFEMIGITAGKPFIAKSWSQADQGAMYRGMTAGKIVADSLYRVNNTIHQWISTVEEEDKEQATY